MLLPVVCCFPPFVVGCRVFFGGVRISSLWCAVSFLFFVFYCFPLDFSLDLGFGVGGLFLLYSLPLRFRSSPFFFAIMSFLVRSTFLYSASVCYLVPCLCPSLYYIFPRVFILCLPARSLPFFFRCRWGPPQVPRVPNRRLWLNAPKAETCGGRVPP